MLARMPGRNALFFVAITVLLDVIGFGVIIPVLPRLLVELTGDTISRAAIDGGWLAFVYAAMQFTFAPVLGNLSDRFGRRPVLLYAIGSLGVDYLIMGFAPTLGWLYLGRAISGIAGASFTPAYAYITDVSPPEKRAQNFGVVGAAFGIGFIIGPALGGLLGSLGPRAPFFAAAALSLTNFVYGALVLPESLPLERRRPFDLRRANPLGTLTRMHRNTAARGILAALFLWQLANQVMPSIWAFYTKYRFAWSEATIGLSLAFSGLLMATSQGTIVRAVVPRWGERRTALTGIAVAGAGFVGYAAATQSWMMFAWLCTWLLGATVMPTTNALLSHRVPADAQGELQGAVSGLYSLSSIVGPPIMTQVFGRFSATGAPLRVPGAPFLLSAALASACWVLYWSASRERPAGAPAAYPASASSSGSL